MRSFLDHRPVCNFAKNLLEPACAAAGRGALGRIRHCHRPNVARSGASRLGLVVRGVGADRPKRNIGWEPILSNFMRCNFAMNRKETLRSGLNSTGFHVIRLHRSPEHTLLRLAGLLQRPGFRYVRNADQAYGEDGRAVFLHAVFVRT